MNKIKYYFVDLFAGAGGVTTGISRSSLFGNNIAKVVYCINHDKNAILSHSLNHPDCVHSTEDIRTASLQPIVDIINNIRKKDPSAIICLWASLECTNHSKAKGHMSRNADSRTLANHLFRYFAINPDMIWIENVKEFLDWGPLKQKRDKDNNLVFDKQGFPVMIPIPEKKGVDFNKWIKKVVSHNKYQYENILINAADYGSPQKRNRLFIQFAKPGLNITWPEKTHNKKGDESLIKWNSVAPLLDLKDLGQSIFKKKKTSEKSLDKILISLKRFIPLKEKHWLFDYQYKNIGNSISEPCPTLIARQDKKPKYLLSPKKGKGLEILSTDSPKEKEIKEFLIEHSILDVYMRQLTIKEMLKIMGFPEDYQLIGTIADKKKFIGNAVPTDIVKMLIEQSVRANLKAA